MAEKVKIFESPYSFFSALFLKIESTLPVAPNLCPYITFWFYGAKQYYDPNCNCKKTPEQLQKIETEYRNMEKMNQAEINRVLEFMDESCILLQFNGETVSKLQKK